jgi:hypothetical protein
MPNVEDGAEERAGSSFRTMFCRVQFLTYSNSYTSDIAVIPPDLAPSDGISTELGSAASIPARESPPEREG